MEDEIARWSAFKRDVVAMQTAAGELAHLRYFESIEGLSSSDVLSIGKRHVGIARLETAVLILGVLYKSH